MMRIAIYVAIAVAAPMGVTAQTADSAPAFEVVSIKLSDPGKGHVGFLTYPGGRVNGGHLTLRSMMAAALEVQDFQITGGPAWVGDDKFGYDIDARVPVSSESARSNPAHPADGLSAEQRQMVLTMMVDRFALKFHRETREGPVFLLTKGNKPLRLAEPANTSAFAWVGSATDGGMMTGTGIHGVNASMPLLANRLMWYFERPVLDETGIQGSFDFKFELIWDGPPITRMAQIRGPEVTASIVTSLEAIGLKLEPTRRPIESIVIDRAEKASEN